MKKLKVLYILLVIAFGVLIFAACNDSNKTDPQQLAAPTNLHINGTDLSWIKVTNASGYAIQINTQTPISIADNSITTYSLESLPEGIYSIKVKAIGDGVNYTDSEWSLPKAYPDEDTDEDTPVISKTLENFTVNLTGAKQLGIGTYAKLTDTASQATSVKQINSMVRVFSSQGEDENSEDNDELVLVKVDENGNVEEVELFEDNDNETAKTIDDYELEIYKMCVFGEFTAVSYISSYWRETQPDEEQWCYNDIVIYNRLKTEISDNFNYCNNEVMSSYLIHNATGKVYSTEAITATNKCFHTGENFMTAGNYITTYDGFLRVCSQCAFDVNCYHENKDWYDLSINDDGELELKDLLPNKDFSVKHAVKDIYGWIYVATSSINEVNHDKKIIYFVGDGYMDGVNNAYKLASNGKVYFGSDNIVPFAIYYGYATVMIDGEPTPVSRQDNFDSIRGDDGYMIDGVYYYSGNLASGEGGYTIGIDCVNKTEVRMSYNNLPTYTHSTYGELTYINQLYSIKDFYSIEYRTWIGRNENTGKWELYYIRISEYKYDEVTMLDVIECELLLDNIDPTSSGQYHYAEVSSQGTTIYGVIIGENGKPEKIQHSNTSYEYNMIILQPLN